MRTPAKRLLVTALLMMWGAVSEAQESRRSLWNIAAIPGRSLRIPTSTKPRGELRAENITDEEVRQVQAAVQPIAGDAVVNISGVTVGCNCEESPSCTEQVWIVAYRPRSSMGLSLSRVDGQWVIGVLQKWVLKNDELLQTYARLEPEYDPGGTQARRLIEAFQRHQEQYPVCSDSKSE